MLNMNTDIVVYEWYCLYINEEGVLETMWTSYFYDEEADKEYEGWAMDAGVTYYFCCAFQNQNVFTGEEVPTGEYVFKVDWLCEKPAEEEYD